VDIKELMRTYVFLNDPDVKEVTTKFGIVLVGVAVVAAGAWAGVNYAGSDSSSSPTASQADGSGDGSGTADASDGEDHGMETECTDEDQAREWQMDNPEKLERTITVEERDGQVCYTYATE